MKPVLQTIIDKNGGEEIRFNPTARMILFAMGYAKDQSKTHEEVCESLGFDRAIARSWAKKYGQQFNGWLEEMVDTHEDTRQAEVLEAVGMVHAVQGNFQFWKEMARAKGVIKDEQKEIKLTINTDFSKFEGLSFEEYRRGILGATRGVEYERRPGVVEASFKRLEGSPDSPGVRTSPVQNKPLEMANALGKDRGRPQQGAAIPAVPSRPAPVRDSKVLAGVHEASDAEEPSDDGYLAF